jgi:hypothetical protein
MFSEGELLNYKSFDVGTLSPEETMKRLRWMVFKVKQKASQNYYDKIVGETQKLSKTSPYSYNWPYDYFSLVELAKANTEFAFTPTNPLTPSSLAITDPLAQNIPNPGDPTVGGNPNVLGSINPLTANNPGSSVTQPLTPTRSTITNPAKTSSKAKTLNPLVGTSPGKQNKIATAGPMQSVKPVSPAKQTGTVQPPNPPTSAAKTNANKTKRSGVNNLTPNTPKGGN